MPRVTSQLALLLYLEEIIMSSLPLSLIRSFHRYVTYAFPNNAIRSNNARGIFQWEFSAVPLNRAYEKGYDATRATPKCRRAFFLCIDL